MAVPDEGVPEPEVPAGLSVLLAAVLDVGSELDLRSTLQHLTDSAVALTGACRGVLGVLDQEQGAIVAAVTTGGPPPNGPPWLPPDVPVDAVLHEPEVLAVPIPVREHGQDAVFGRLRLTGKQAPGFSGDDLELLRALAAQAGIAIGNARLYETATQRERWIEGAAAVTNALLTGRDDDALTTVAEQARRLADAAAGVVLQPTDEGGMRIVAAASADADPASLLGTTIEPGSAVLAELLAGEPVFIEDSATDPRMTTEVRFRFGPSMMLPLRADGQLIGTLALPRTRGDRPYTSVDHRLATQFASQAALALVLADARAGRERLAVFEDRDRIARDLHDLVVQRLFATGMMLESTQRRAPAGEVHDMLTHAVDELESTIQEVRTAIFALQQPPADAPTTFRGKVLREKAGAAAVLGFAPSVHFTGPVEAAVPEPVQGHLLTALRRALATAARRPAVSRIDVSVDAEARLPDGRPAVRLTVTDDGRREDADTDGGTTVTWQSPL
ncbi:GAF domain-containing protein [Streptomyces beihaiensis]|uniref:GAF domain-containing protein n=1 Tax=Streptomyces beihaiensis TaxID=2984495 RepID=A0ABT3TNR4_9ACTN|nr:GAF domain-containing protein [Streptomyces beihaiensis]MCX3058674.1 GAF domain-containing protein [Streptomyces beihaiensis]